MTNKGHALSRDELVRSLTAYSGITSADGAADGTTLVDANLNGRNDFIKEKTILIMSGDAKDEDKGALSFVNTPPATITLQGTGFSAQIKAGTIYRVLNISTVEIDVANMDAKIGTNTDPAGTTTLFAWLAKLLEHGGAGLVYYGKVTQIDDATHFRVAGLTGFGDAYFANTYRAYVVRDAAGLGAAPQGEMQPCSVYTSTDGIFTHTAFSVGLAVDDEVLLLHERIAEIKDLIDRLGAFTGTENLKAILGDLSTTKRLGQILGGLDETDTLKAILGAFTATENLKAILGNLSTTKNLGSILGALTTTDNLKAILGAYTAAANLKAAIDAVALEATLGTHDTDIKALLATIAAYIDTEVASILAAVDTEVAAILADTGTDGVVINSRTAAFEKLVGVAQIKATTEDLQQAAASYDLVTGTTQDVIIESLVLRCPVNCSDDVGAFTGISIQTDDTTAQEFISQANGVKANLTQDAQLAWTGAILLKATKKIQLTIYGGAADDPTVCDIVVKCRAVVSGGYLT